MELVVTRLVYRRLEGQAVHCGWEHDVNGRSRWSLALKLQQRRRARSVVAALLYQAQEPLGTEVSLDIIRTSRSRTS